MSFRSRIQVFNSDGLAVSNRNEPSPSEFFSEGPLEVLVASLLDETALKSVGIKSDPLNDGQPIEHNDNLIEEDC